MIGVASTFSNNSLPHWHKEQTCSSIPYCPGLPESTLASKQKKTKTRQYVFSVKKIYLKMVKFSKDPICLFDAVKSIGESQSIGE